MTDLIAELAEVVRLADKATHGIWPNPTCPDATPNEALIQLGAGYIEFGGSRHQREANAEAVVEALNYLRAHHATLTRIIESEAEMRAELEKARKDAGRWRYIRDAFDGLKTSRSERFLECLGIDGDIYKPLDDAIDAAMHDSAREGSDG